MTILTQMSRPMWDMLEDMLVDDGGIESGFGYRRYPPVNLWISGDEVLVDAEVPGVDPRTIDISLKDDVLQIAGERAERNMREGESYHRQERPYGRFSRTVTMPFRGDGAKVEATCRNGILRIRVPRAEGDKPRRIAIAAE